MANMNKIIEKMDARMDRIESTLDTIATNHLSHVEKYTKWTLIGIVISVSLSMMALATTIL